MTSDKVTRKHTAPHERLEAWKAAMDLAKIVYKYTTSLPADEHFGLTSQLKRAAVSVPSNIAEGAGRHTRKELLNFLYMSRGSLSEIETQVRLSEELGLSRNGALAGEVWQKLERSQALLNGLIRSLQS